jgi:hypothetical protein
MKKAICSSLVVVVSVLLLTGNAWALPPDSVGPPGDVSLIDRVIALEAAVSTLQTELNTANSQIDSLQTDLATANNQITSLQTDLATANSQIATLQADLTELQDTADFAIALEPYVSVESDTINGLIGPHIIFTGANIHIRSGDEDPGSGTNGVGNLIIGYNMDYEIGTHPEDRFASHVVVIGDQHRYTSRGGLVAGYMNTISGWGATVTCGEQNRADGPNSSVSGGSENRATGRNASVSGGLDNEASGNNSSISGGLLNDATGLFSSVTGGEANEAVGNQSVVSGGNINIAEGSSSTVSGGTGVNTHDSKDWGAGGGGKMFENGSMFYYDNDGTP